MSYTFYNTSAAQWEWHYQQALQTLLSLKEYQDLDPEGQSCCESDLNAIFSDGLPPDYKYIDCPEYLSGYLGEWLADSQTIAGEQLVMIRQYVQEILNSRTNLGAYLERQLNKFAEFINKHEAIYSEPLNVGLELKLPIIDYAEVLQMGRGDR